MKLKNNIFQNSVLYILYILVLLGTLIYSYSLVDPNFTLFNGSAWDNFRNWIIQLGYFHRDTSTIIYFLIIATLFLFSWTAIKSAIHPVVLACVIGGVLLLSYPLLSHDFFNYMFDAKIVTVYHQSPYIHKALDYPGDTWVRFMQWTHRTYPYGPTFLIVTLFPSFLSLGKFLLDFVLFKLLFVGTYVLSAWLLNKMNRIAALLFVTSPLVIIEGLVNTHNDLIALAFAIVGAYFLTKNKKILSITTYILSGGVKYITLPLVLFSTKNKYAFFIGIAGVIGLISYLSFKSEVQPWYFLALFACLPFYRKFISSLNIFFAGLLFSYFPYLRFDGWVGHGSIDMKHTIILIALICNIVYLYLTEKDLSFLLPDTDEKKETKK